MCVHPQSVIDGKLQVETMHTKMYIGIYMKKHKVMAIYSVPQMGLVINLIVIRLELEQDCTNSVGQCLQLSNIKLWSGRVMVDTGARK